MSTNGYKPTRSNRLTDKQRLFVESYLRCMNATQAARDAGYKGNSNTLGVVGHENLRKPKIRQLIDKRMKEAAMGADEVIYRLSRMAEGVADDFIDVIADQPFQSWQKLRDSGKLGLVKELRYDNNGRPIVKFYDSQTALVHLGKYHALFTEKREIIDWRTRAIELIRNRELTHETLAEEVGVDLATQLFAAAGIQLNDAGSD